MKDLIAIKDIDKDLPWSRDSFDAGHPKCICGLCGLKIKDSDAFDDLPLQQREKESNNNFPIRIWRGEGKAMEELTLHLACFTLLNKAGHFQEGFNIQ